MESLEIILEKGFENLPIQDFGKPSRYFLVKLSLQRLSSLLKIAMPYYTLFGLQYLER